MIDDELLEALRTAQRTMQGEHPWVPGGVFLLSNQLAPTMIKMIDIFISSAQELQPARVIHLTAQAPCPCECNSGGFCGGCGHAGCGRR